VPFVLRERGSKPSKKLLVEMSLEDYSEHNINENTTQKANRWQAYTLNVLSKWFYLTW
jgi:hypothetical protein